MEHQVFEKDYRVHVFDCGPDGRLNLCSLLNFFQDIASDHAVMLGFGREELLKQNHFWVLSRMYAEFNSWPAWGASVKVRTWPDGTDKLFAVRNFQAWSPGNVLVANATSSWLILDQTTRKIQRPDALLSRFRHELANGNHPVRLAAKVSSAGSPCRISESFRIAVSDLDINLHTNNVNYIKWVSDTYEPGFVLKNCPSSVEINYLSESVFGQEVFIKSSVCHDDSCEFTHSVLRKEDNRELCNVRIRWTEVI